MASQSDNFDRANGEIGANWTEDRGDIDIDTNEAVAQSAAAFDDARYTASALDSADHYVQADTTWPGGEDKSVGIVARRADADIELYRVEHRGTWSGIGYALIKEDGGETVLDTAASDDANPITQKLTVDGATQSFEVDSVEVCSDTDSGVTAGNYCGIWGAWSNGQKWNDWEAADLAAPPAAAPTAILDGPLAGPLGGPI